jgi:ATP-binding cassette subfamily B protein
MSRPKTLLECLPRSWSIGRHIAPRLKEERSRITAALAALLAGVILRTLEPWPLKFVIDLIVDDRLSGARTGSAGLAIPSDPLRLAALAAVAFVVVAAARAWTDFYQAVSFALIGNRVLTRLRNDLYRHLQRLSLAYHDRSRNGDLTVRIVSDVNMLKDVAVSAMLPLLASTLILVSMFAVMLWMHVKLALIAASVFPALWFITTRSSRQIHAAARKQRKREGALAATAAESISAVKSVQAMSLQAAFDRSFSNQSHKSQKEGVKTSRLTAGLERKVDVLIAIATALVLWQGAKYVIAGELSPGALVVFLTYLKRGFKPLQDFAKYTGRLSKATAAGERVVEILDQTPQIKDAADAIEAPPFHGQVSFENVCFSYPGPNRVLDQFTLQIPAGTRVAIVGPSGIGKSTILSLLMRLYDPDSGRISIDGHDLRHLKVDSLRSQISAVLQDCVLFAGTIADNIAVACPDATRDDIERVARLANADVFISQLAAGYDSDVGERGVTLSRGQRQRLAIARAALRPTPLLLLDEPTTGLDEENERSVSSALQRLMQGRTSILVTHNLRLAAEADLIVVLEEGGVAEIGTHLQLLQQRGTYSRIYTSQNPAAPPRASHATVMAQQTCPA